MRLGGAKQRAVLALLLLHANEVVSTDRLIDELWGESPPESAANMLQGYVSHLRKILEPGRGRGEHELLVSRPPGYVLHIDPNELDAERFLRLAGEGRGLFDAGDAKMAAERLPTALALWRGPALADVAYESFARREVERLEELRLGVLEDRIDADLALARHEILIAELRELVAEHPFQERLRAQLMLALYRSGRQAEALAVYQDARRVLVEELGLEPSRTLQDLEKAILTHDDALDGPARTEQEARDAAAPATAQIASEPREERKVVTVLLADVARVAPRADPMDPEDVHALLAPCHQRLCSELERFGATVERYIGDAVMALFGAPTAHEDDPERALRAALAIRDWAVEDDELQLRVAVDTGEALIALGTSPAGGVAMASGDVVNGTARLHSAAPANGILVGETTYRATRQLVDYRAAETVDRGEGVFRFEPGRRLRPDRGSLSTL